MPIRSPETRDGVEITVNHGKYTALGYRSARVATREGRVYSEGSGDLHLECDRKSLINQSRAFYRDNPIYHGMIDRLVCYIVGTGFGLRVMNAGSKGPVLENAWRKWFNMSDIRGAVNGSSAAVSICREMLLCGDTGCLKLANGQVQYVEAEQITDGRNGTGIKLDEYRKPISFSVCPYNDQGRLAISKITPVEAQNFLFIAGPRRPSQTRAEPPLQTAFPLLHMVNDVCTAEAFAWESLSRLALSITRDTGEERAYAESTADETKATTETAGETAGDIAARLMVLDYGIIYHGRPGDKVEGIARNIPGDNFTESLKTYLRIIGLSVGMPLEVVFLMWTDSNYSQSRAVIEQFYQTVVGFQECLERSYYQPLFDWKRADLFAQAGIADDGEEIGTDWIAPSFPWIDQLKESQAKAIKLDRCLTTHAHVLKELNLDREDIVSERVAEIIDAMKKSQQIKTEGGLDHPYQDLCGLEVPKPAAPAPAPAETAADANQKDSGNA